MSYGWEQFKQASSDYSPLSEAARLRREHREALRAVQTLESRGSENSGTCSAAAAYLRDVEEEMREAGIEVPHPLQVLWR